MELVISCRPILCVSDYYYSCVRVHLKTKPTLSLYFRLTDLSGSLSDFQQNQSSFKSSIRM